MKVHL
jgi:hypothetical protein